MIAGPTGVGKSAFAVDLAREIGGEIFCADAFQVYRGLAALTAQPGPRLTEQVPHHFYGSVDPSETMDAARWAVLARECAGAIAAKGRVPLLVGGSGLYLRAYFGGLQDAPAADPSVRARVAALSHSEALRQLAEIDPAAPTALDTANPRRVSRALEIILQTGRPLAESRRTPPPAMPGILLIRSREELHARIRANVLALLDSGAIHEVAAHPTPGLTASRAIGHREILAFLHGQISREEATDRIITATLRYAKRQLTWFRNQTTLQEVYLSASRPDHEPLQEALQAFRNY